MPPLSLNKLKRKQTAEVVETTSANKSTKANNGSEKNCGEGTLEDYLKPDLDLVFVGINPSLKAAETGRYYAGPGNHFYKLLYESKLIPIPITYEEDEKLLEYNIGLTNIVARPTRSSADLSRSEIKKGAMIAEEKLKKFKPKIAIFNGKCIYEEFGDYYDKSCFCFGLQPKKVGSTSLWVVPSSSARCANFPRMQDKLHFYTSLKSYLSYLKGEIKEISLKDFVFNGKAKQAIPKTSKMWRRQETSAFSKGGKVVNKETFCMDTSDENVCSVLPTQDFVLDGADKDDIEMTLENVKDASNSESSSCKILTEDNLQDGNSANKLRAIKSKPQVSKKLSPRNKSKSTINLRPRETRTNTIDFVSMIKQKINEKKDLNEGDSESSDTKPKHAGRKSRKQTS